MPGDFVLRINPKRFFITVDRKIGQSASVGCKAAPSEYVAVRLVMGLNLGNKCRHIMSPGGF